MICRNCSAEIDDNCEKCPICKKDPKQKQKNNSALFTVIAVIICFALVCGCVYFGINLIQNKENNTSAAESASQSAAYISDSGSVPTDSIYASADSPFESKIINRVDISDRSGTKIATRAFVEVNKSEFKNINEEAFVRFLESHVKTAVYSWFTIKFEDSTGIVFNGNWIKTAAYGELDENGFVKNVYGRIILTESGKYLYLPTPQENDVSPEGAEPTSATANKSSNSQEQAAKKKKATTVYVTASGTKYHKAGCAYLKKSKIKTTLAKAKKEGYTACSKCFN